MPFEKFAEQAYIKWSCSQLVLVSIQRRLPCTWAYPSTPGKLSLNAQDIHTYVMETDAFAVSRD